MKSDYMTGSRLIASHCLVFSRDFPWVFVSFDCTPDHFSWRPRTSNPTRGAPNGRIASASAGRTRGSARLWRGAGATRPTSRLEARSPSATSSVGSRGHLGFPVKGGRSGGPPCPVPRSPWFVWVNRFEESQVFPKGNS